MKFRSLAPHAALIVIALSACLFAGCDNGENQNNNTANTDLQTAPASTTLEFDEDEQAACYGDDLPAINQ
ncbi:MAG: hypothetical protein IKE43_04325 [Coriobacteriales bacterium]|nr:hypothetical protein [Coriobacteriales bacterium]